MPLAAANSDLTRNRDLKVRSPADRLIASGVKRSSDLSTSAFFAAASARNHLWVERSSPRKPPVSTASAGTEGNLSLNAFM
jgi:hypothetical protein